jgi:hypothetical protein
MSGRMLYKGLPILILGLTALLTAAAIEFLPETLYFPVIEYSTPENIQFALLKNGELDKSACEQGAGQVAHAIRANCPACKVVERCLRGLDAERRKILSREPLATPSVRLPGGKLSMTISAADPQLALAVCRQTEAQTASQPADQRLRCYPALAPR